MKLLKTILVSFVFLTTTTLCMGQNIYPTPQKAEINSNNKFSLSKGVKVINKGIDKESLELLESLLPINNNSKFTVTIGGKDKSLPMVEGAYYLKINKKGILINANESKGIFYGLQTLRQLIDNSFTVVECEITDFPAIKFRGVVEGFYGKPWSHRDRLAQFKFYGENKLNTYIYGPKDDPYHCSLAKAGNGGWRVPYPKDLAEKIAELAITARKNKVDFVWAIHPGQDIKWNEQDYNNLLSKFESMYNLGVKSFAVFFDDISGEGTDALKQANLLNRINREFVRVKKDVTPLILCPTEYNKSWSNPSPDGYLPILGKNLDKDIQIMWTGDKVCADITMETLNWVNERIERPTYIWWNYPVTDYVKNVVLQGPAKGITKEATAYDMAGFVSNPMENAEASKIALFGVADYTWNPSKYNETQTWEAAIKTIMPNISEAYRKFAIHSSQIDFNAHGYYMDESWETSDDLDSLKKEFKDLSIASEVIIEQCQNSFLVDELLPWLKQADLLGKRGIKAISMIELFNTNNFKQAWEAYLECGMTQEQRTAYNANKVGLHKLQPFIDNSRKNVADNIYQKISGIKIAQVKPISSFPRVETINFMTDGNSLTYYNTFQAQQPSCWVGIDLGEVKDIKSIYIEQGRYNNDSYYMKSGILEGSLDGQNWEQLMIVPDKSYIITCSNVPNPLRYIRLKANNDNNTKSRLTIRKFEASELQNTPEIYTNMSRLASSHINVNGKSISINPILEVINVAPGNYFGIKLPDITSIDKVNIHVGNDVNIEYSLDGIVWSNNSLNARYIRAINNTNSPIDLNLKQFEITKANNNKPITNLFDGNLATSYQFYGIKKIEFIGNKKVTILSSALSGGKIKAICADGTFVYLGQINGSLNEFNLPSNTVALELEGAMEIYEIISHS